MSMVVLLIVAAMWVAVLLPPFLRSRTENRPTSSVADFRNQLNSLQRSLPPRGGVQMRAMSRSLAPSRVPHRPIIQPQHRQAMSRTYTPEPTAGIPRREHIRRRRQNVLTWLVGIVGVSMFLAFTTANQVMITVFVISALVLVAYCYILVQIRRAEFVRRPHRSWYDAA